MTSLAIALDDLACFESLLDAADPKAQKNKGMTLCSLGRKYSHIEELHNPTPVTIALGGQRRSSLFITIAIVGLEPSGLASQFLIGSQIFCTAQTITLLERNPMANSRAGTLGILVTSPFCVSRATAAGE